MTTTERKNPCAEPITQTRPGTEPPPEPTGDRGRQQTASRYCGTSSVATPPAIDAASSYSGRGSLPEGRAPAKRVVTSADILALLRARPDAGASQDDVDDWVARKHALIAAIEEQTR